MIKAATAGMLAALALTAAVPAHAEIRSAMALPVTAQAGVPAECLVRPNVPADKGRDKDGDGIFDDCGTARAAPDDAQYAKAGGGLGVSPGILAGILAILAAVFAAAGGGGGNDSPG